MTDLTEKTTALDEQSAVENSEEITQTPSVWKEILSSPYKLSIQYNEPCILIFNEMINSGGEALPPVIFF